MPVREKRRRNASVARPNNPPRRRSLSTAADHLVSSALEFKPPTDAPRLATKSSRLTSRRNLRTMASMRAAQAMAACHVGANNLAFRRGSMAGASVNLTVKRASARSESALDAFEHNGITAAEGQRGRGRGARSSRLLFNKAAPPNDAFSSRFPLVSVVHARLILPIPSRFDINRRSLR